MQIAILGYGTVGGGVGRLVAQQQHQVQQLQVTHIFVRPTHPRTQPEMSDDFEAIINDSHLDVVVETLGGVEPAHQYILAAMRHGKHVVTANKAVVARYLQEFTQVAAAHHVHFYYEASTGGGIPWLRNLEQAARVDSLDRLAGILNGTSNYILDQMASQGVEFEVALRSAQQLGYAEADPTADVAGIDVQNKLRISTAVAFNVDPQFALPTWGISGVRQSDIRDLQRLGLTLKLMGTSVRHGDHVAAVVAPTVVVNDSLFAHTPGNFNLIALHGESVGDLQFYGQGAGAAPTANAIVQDVLDIAHGVPHLHRDFAQPAISDDDLLTGDYLVRGAVGACPGVTDSMVGSYYWAADVHPAVMARWVAAHPDSLALRLSPAASAQVRPTVAQLAQGRRAFA